MRTRIALIFVALSGAACWSRAEPLPEDKRPAWLTQDGIVMAGSWEPLLFRVRRDGAAGYTPSAEQIEAYRREHSTEMVARLKALGVNFVMMHCYKGAGLNTERESMADAVRFAALCREQGLRVGVYNYSGAFLWEPFFKEMPSARDWVVLGPGDQPMTYESTGYRYYWNRNHPAAEEFYRGLVRFAVQEIKTDLIHFDNYVIGPGYDANSVARFRQYLGDTFSTAELATMGVTDLLTAQPPRVTSNELLRRAWQDFTSRSLAESYQRMGQFARSLRSNVLVECNPNGVPDTIVPPVDHGQLLEGGEAFWVESGRVGMMNGHLITRVRNYKVGRALTNMTFDYTVTPLEMAESMAFNLDCLGCITWFEYGQLVAVPGSKDPLSPALAPFIRFFQQHRDLLRGADVVADLAVVRSFPSQVFGGRRYADLTTRLENLLIENRGCFQIIYDTQLRRMRPGQLPLLALAGCVALSDEDAQALRRHVSAGGKLCLIGALATHDRWMRPRSKAALADLPKDSVLELPENGDWLAAIRRWAGGSSLAVETQPSLGLCTELTDQPNRRLVHLVNYRKEQPLLQATVTVRLPPTRRATFVRLASPEHDDQPTVQFTQSENTVQFRVPRIGIYEIAVVELAAVPDSTPSKPLR
jgi:Glycosyl hydrolase-like 10